MKSLGALFLIALAGLAQQPASSRLAPKVDGRVINALSGDPVKKATVLLQPREAGRGAAYSADTDSNGHFVIEDIEPGVYTPTADRSGFMTQVRGAPGARPGPVTVERGQDLTGVTIRLIPLGVITGRLLDEDGDPIRGGTVEAMVNGYVEGKKQLRVVSQTQSNNKGDFRLYNLQPGTFYLRGSRANQVQFVTPRNVFAGTRLQGGYAPTYYPSTTEPPAAAPIAVAAGAQLKGADIQMRRERLYTVRGKQSLDPAHRHMSLEIDPVNSDPNIEFQSTVRMANDTFEFPDLPPGSYVIVGIRVDGEKKRSFAREPVEIVNADVEGVSLTFAPGVDITGVVRVEGTLPSASRILVSLQLDTPWQFGQPATMAKPDGSFELQDVAPDIYQVNVGPIQGSYLKSVRVRDREINDARVDLTRGPVSRLVLTLGADVGRIEGKVQTARGDPAVRVRVTCIPYGSHAGRGDLSRFAFTDEKGSFRIPSVPPGEYKLFAWEDVQMGAPQDPEFRKRFEKQSVPLTMPPNGHETVELTAIKVGE